MRRFLASLAASALICLGIPATAGAVVVGQIDTFQDGIDNWFAGGLGSGQVPLIPPEVAPTGGPGGAGDAFLQITGLGVNGPGSKITAINGTQWAGNYLAAGVTSIAVDLLNLGATDLTVRLQLEDAMGGPPVDEAVTTFGAVLPVGSDWTHVVFPISAADLTIIHGSAATLLSQVTFLRIIQNPIRDESAPVRGVLGVDNISALAVSEPSSMVLALTGLLALSIAGWRGRREFRGNI
jgi:hypothetical protein